MAKSFTVVFEHGDRPNQWLASVKELPECHTFGRGLEQTRARVREALAVWIGDESAEEANLIEQLPLPPPARKKLRALSEACDRLEKLNEARSALVAELVAILSDGAWSVRDIGQVVGLSHQRVHQIAGSDQSAAGRLAGRGTPARRRGRVVASTSYGRRSDAASTTSTRSRRESAKTPLR